jgi:hypothetical protein
MDTLYHFLGGIVAVLVLSYSLKNIAKVPFAARFTWATYLVSFLIYFREVTQFQTRNFESSIFTGWNPWSELYPWSIDKQLETFLPIVILVIIASMVCWVTGRK